jgi:FkbM family methyltransferase
LYETGIYEPFQLTRVLELLQLRRRHYGNGVFAIDCGACIGIHTIEWCSLMHEWGFVIAIEAQERLYYALCGNIALNNCFNVKAINAAVGAQNGPISIPKVNWYEPARYGSVELKRLASTEDVGQPISYEPSQLIQVQGIRLDSLALRRVDFIKLDVEGMEVDALEGASALLDRDKPFLVIEIIKTDTAKLQSFLAARGYRLFRLGAIDVLAVHQDDKMLPEVAQRDWTKDA